VAELASPAATVSLPEFFDEAVNSFCSTNSVSEMSIYKQKLRVMSNDMINRALTA